MRTLSLDKQVPPSHHATIVIEGNKIVGAGRSSEITVPADATVIDTSGRTMLPGLIDAHGHLLVLGQSTLAPTTSCGSCRREGGPTRALACDPKAVADSAILAAIKPVLSLD